ncbi:hypothetical protein FACS189499_06380 [Clostridia bacterium]|nr:hypothetical protein FACS189499_06380 [Clostridia bacterium]
MEIYLNMLLLGVFLSIMYEPLRLLREMINHTAPAVIAEDLIFFFAAGIFSFAYAVEYGAGEYRFYFLICEAVGAAGYFLTAGRAVAFIEKALAAVIVLVIKATWNYILCPVLRLLNKTKKFLFAFVKKIAKRLINYLLRSKQYISGVVKTKYRIYKAKQIRNKTQVNIKKKKGEAVVSEKVQANVVKRAAIKAKVTH